MRPIGLFGGTFDPVHRGHLETARHVYKTLALEQVRFVLSARPPHRDPPVASARHRANMLQLAMTDEDGFEYDDRELRRPGPSYTVWTLRSLRMQFPNRPLALIVGADALISMPTWFHWPEILTLAHLVVLPRPGHGLTAESAAWYRDWLCRDAAALMSALSGRVLVSDAPLIDVSATALRAAIHDGRNVTPDLSPAVWSYIQHNALYGYCIRATRKHAS